MTEKVSILFHSQMNKSAPHSRCNFLNNDPNILVGAKPRREDLRQIIQSGVTHFVCLDEKSFDYEKYLPDGISASCFHIASGGKGSVSLVKRITDFVLGVLEDGGAVYIHCQGGHGRAGMIAAVLCGRLWGMDALEAVRTVESSREEREDRSRNFIPTPETQSQISMVVKFCGPGETTPDRSDRKWLAQVKLERKKARSS